MLNKSKFSSITLKHIHLISTPLIHEEIPIQNPFGSQTPRYDKHTTNPTLKCTFDHCAYVPLLGNNTDAWKKLPCLSVSDIPLLCEQLQDLKKCIFKPPIASKWTQIESQSYQTHSHTWNTQNNQNLQGITILAQDLEEKNLKYWSMES